MILSSIQQFILSMIIFFTPVVAYTMQEKQKNLIALIRNDSKEDASFNIEQIKSYLKEKDKTYLKELLNEKKKINDRSYTLLGIAIICNRLDVVKLLFDSLGQENQKMLFEQIVYSISKNNFGYPPFIYAVHLEKQETVRALFELATTDNKKMILQQTLPFDNRTALFEAILQKDSGMVKLLLESARSLGNDILNSVLQQKLTTSYDYFSSWHILEAGERCTIDAHGCSPFLLAMLFWLRIYNDNVNEFKKFLPTFRDIASTLFQAADEDVKKDLLKEEVLYITKTPLQMAAKCGDLDLIKNFLNAAGDQKAQLLMQQNGDGATALTFASTPEIEDYLVQELETVQEGNEQVKGYLNSYYEIKKIRNLLSYLQKKLIKLLEAIKNLALHA